MQAILPLLSYVIPLLGKGLLMIPFVPNRVIPLVLGAANIAHKYWVLLGFPAFTTAMANGIDERFAIAGIGGSLVGALPFVWGIAEQYLFHRLYEGKRAEAKLGGKVSWLESGKSDMFKKPS